MTNQSTMWRPANRGEIREYYRDIFPATVDDLPRWITPTGPKQFAFALSERFPRGSRDRPAADFIRRDTRGGRGGKFFDDWDSIVKMCYDPAYHDVMRGNNDSQALADPDVVDGSSPAAEAVYYGLDHHEQFWVLAFDIDAKDVAKQRIADGKSYTEVSEDEVEEAGIIENAPGPAMSVPAESGENPDRIHTFEYEFKDIDTALEYAFELSDWLEKTVGFDEIKVFYSGQGAHIYALSDDPYYLWTQQSRRFITTYIKEKLGIPIDEQVTWDQQRVMRLPNSFHSDVCRKVTEIHSPDFDYLTQALPNHLE